MKFLICFILLGILFPSFANDGAYYTRGGSIFPMQETKISMDKEELSFVVRDGVAEARIRFEFFNPENTARTLKVGFQAPSAAGDVLDSISNSVEIKDFIIMQNGHILPYEIKVAECEDCELKDPGELEFSQFNPGIYVFLFEVTFQPGKNVINHSYAFPKSSNVEFDASFNYILTTGSKWAGKKIKDFTLNIDMGPNQYFFVRDIFGGSADWSINGTGKVTDKFFPYINDIQCRMVRTLNGALQIHIKDFEPTQNIEFGVIDKNSFVNHLVNYTEIMKGEVVSFEYFHIDEEAPKETLRLLRNTVYAQHNYAFNSVELREYFQKFAWYMPDPNVQMSDIKLSSEEQDFVDKILELEKQ
ncbi:MAG: YARHG domain-containing protein [Crocinitomicaceae bacterium]